MKYLRFLILWLAYPLLKFLGEMYPERKVTTSFVETVKANIETGDVFVTRENMVATNLLIGGKFTHAAIYIGKNTVVEATGIGVHKVPLEKFLYEKDHVCILRHASLSAGEKISAAQKAIKACGTPYDFSFASSHKAFYCAELVWYCYKNPFKRKTIMGVKTVSPDDFYYAHQFLSVCEFY